MISHAAFVSLAVAFLLTGPSAVPRVELPAAVLPYERLVYDVRWSFLNLGTVTISHFRSATDARALTTGRIALRSNPSLPFVDLDLVHETKYDPVDLRIGREMIVIVGGPRTTYLHLAAHRSILMIDTVGGREVRRDTVWADRQTYDANTLLEWARRHAHQIEQLSLPTIVDYRIQRTDMVMTGEREWIEVPAFGQSVRSRRFSGSAHWVGSSFAGMSGGFRGWVSDDDATVPLRAAVKILVGSIIVELRSFDRKGWDTKAVLRPNPPHSVTW